jgi:hypothetical protein
VSINDFFTSEAVSTYITFIFGVIAATIGWGINRWLSRKRPRIIRFLRREQSEVLQVDSRLKDSLKINYKGTPVESLYLTRFTLHSTASSQVKDVILNLEFVDRNPVIDIVPESEMSNRIITVEGNFDMKGGYFQLKIPYMDSHALYKDKIELKVFSREPVKLGKVSGGGTEWRVTYLDIEEESKSFIDDLRRNISNSIGIILILSLNAPKIIRLLRFLRD